MDDNTNARLGAADLDEIGRYIEEEREYAQDSTWTITLFDTFERVYAHARAMEAELAEVRGYIELLKQQGADALTMAGKAQTMNAKEVRDMLICFCDLSTEDLEPSSMDNLVKRFVIAGMIDEQSFLQVRDYVSALYCVPKNSKFQPESLLKNAHAGLSYAAPQPDALAAEVAALAERVAALEREGRVWEYKYPHCTDVTDLTREGWEYIGDDPDYHGDVAIMRRPHQQQGDGEQTA